MYMSFHDLRNKEGAKLEKLVSDKPSLVRFHADYCGHCKAMEPEWDKVKSAISDMKNKQVIDVEHSAIEHVPMHLKKDVDGYPTIRALTNKGKESYSYSGPRDADAIVPWFKSMTPQSGGKRSSRKSRKSRKRRMKRVKKTRHTKVSGKVSKSRRQSNIRSNKIRGKAKRATIRRH